MKKIITLIMLLIFTSFAIFAVETVTNVVYLHSTIPAEDVFSFKFGYKTPETGEYTFVNDNQVSYIIENLNIAEGSTLNFVITQGSRVKLDDNGASYTLSIEVFPWELSSSETYISADYPQVSGMDLNSLSGDAKNDIQIENLRLYNPDLDDYHNVEVQNSETGNIILNYGSGITKEDTTLVTFDTTWKENDNLITGDYVSFLKLTYTSGE